jgi:hypothetical protein
LRPARPMQNFIWGFQQGQQGQRWDND